jgi:hypothetical protein
VPTNKTCVVLPQAKYDKKMKMVRDDLELRRKQEIHEIEERKVRSRKGRLRGGTWRGRIRRGVSKATELGDLPGLVVGGSG